MYEIHNVYKIENKLNNKKYFGVSLNPTLSHKKIAKTLDVELFKKIPSRPGKVSSYTKRYLVNGITSNYFKTAVEAKKYLSDHFGIEITSNRVREVLHKMGLKGVIKKKKPEWNLSKNMNTGLRMIGGELYGLMRPKSTYLALMVLNGV